MRCVSKHGSVLDDLIGFAVSDPSDRAGRVAVSSGLAWALVLLLVCVNKMSPARDLVVGYAAGITAGVAIGLSLAHFDLIESIKRGQLMTRTPLPPQNAADSTALVVPAQASALDIATPVGLLALPTDLLCRVLEKLTVAQIATMLGVSRDFRDGLVQQALALIAPSLSGAGGPRTLRTYVYSTGVMAPAARPSPPPSTLTLKALIQWAECLSLDEAMLEGRLLPGEYHYWARTQDAEGTHLYDAYGALSLFGDGSCRGSALEVAPDGLQAAFTRNGTWQAGTVPSGSTDYGDEPLPEQCRTLIRFDYDYAGEIYEYRLLATSVLPAATRGRDVCPRQVVVLPPGTRMHGPQYCFEGRWARRAHPSELPLSPIEFGRILECRLWRAEWLYSLLPDDATSIEARAMLRAAASMEPGWEPAPDT